jgi:hypothetical protein
MKTKPDMEHARWILPSSEQLRCVRCANPSIKVFIVHEVIVVEKTLDSILNLRM